MNKDGDTEDRIFEAAQAAFHEHGFDGARMADIARRASINQSMLHYYFRTKEQLFDAVFRKAILAVLPPAIAILGEDGPLLAKLERFAHRYVGILQANPHIPAFILFELRRNPEAIGRLAGETAGPVFARFRGDVERAVREGDIRPIEPSHLLANVVGLCVFPFVARPMLQGGLGMGNEAYDGLLRTRADHVADFLRHALRP